jgi:NitT/TauT family transport system substrate-binding protein
MVANRARPRAAALPRLALGVLALALGMACGSGGQGAPPQGPPAAQGQAGSSSSNPGQAAGASQAPGQAAGGSQTSGTPPVAPSNPYLASAGEPATRLEVGVCAVTGGFVHLYTALESNLFAKYGLDVELVTLRGAPPSLAALAAGEIQFLYCAADATITGLASGVDATLIAAPLVGVPFVMITRPEIATFADLRGQSVGITRAGELDDRLSRLALERHGLRPNEDVELRPIAGSQPERYQLMLANVVQANALTPPLDAQAEQDRLHVIYDLAELNLPFVYSAAQASNRLIRDNPRLVQRFVAALAEAVYFTERNPQAARQALGKVLDLQDSSALDSAYNAYARKLVNRELTVPREAVQASIDAVRDGGAPVTKDAVAIVDNRFADDLLATGFLRQLWGGDPPGRNY